MLACTCPIVLVGCTTDSVFSDSWVIQEGMWSADSPIEFEWHVTDTVQSYDFFIDMRHDQSYPFSNIYIFVDFTFPNGKSLRDTVACTLADGRGKWLGTGFGNIVDHRIAFREKTQFPSLGDYGIRITHGMRENPLSGMLDVGFRLEMTGD